MTEGDTLRDERIDMGGVAFVCSILQRLVQGTDVFTSKTLDNQHHDILLRHWHGVGWHMYRCIDALHLFRIAKIVGHYKDRFPNSAIE